MLNLYCMKKISFFVIVLLLGVSVVQSLEAQQANTPPVPIDEDSKKIMYREVVSQDGTPDYLYDRAIEWFRSYYPNPTSVYTVQDKVNGKIEGIARLTLRYDDPDGLRRDAGIVQYNIKVELKENRYRYTLTDFTYKTASRYPCEKWLNKADPAYNPLWDSYVYQIDTTMRSLVSKMKEGMKPVVIKKDEW